MSASVRTYMDSPEDRLVYIDAWHTDIVDGALAILDKRKAVIAEFAAGTWLYYEVID